MKEDVKVGDIVLVIDFGGQYTHLIARRIRQLKVYSETRPFTISIDEIVKLRPKGIILSGGPRSVYTDNSPKVDKRIFDLGIPILGICYGHQLIAYMLGGKVIKSTGEYGKAILKIYDTEDPLFKGLNEEEIVWMSHRDSVIELPGDFKVLASTEITPIAAFKHKYKPIYGVQFHPEVVHTKNGLKMLSNFLFDICKCTPSWNPKDLIADLISYIRRKVGPNERVLCAVSGGVDSTTTAVLVHRAIGDRLVAVFVDHGLLRKGEPEFVVKTLRNMGLNLIHINAKERFLSKLKGVSDPEEKRKIIGEEFIRIFEEIARKIPNLKWLAQGTIYPDVIESGRVGAGAARIKSHHNVGGLPERMNLKLLEPLKYFYKDEVREIARALGIPDEIVRRHPFPGPGLAVRIIGEVTEEKLRIVREASAIVEEELKRAGLYDKVWQAFAVVGDDKWVGVLGDERYVGYIVIVRIVESVDAMTADWVRVPYEVLDRISRRITREVEGVTMVTYAITSKPPSTIEPC